MLFDMLETMPYTTNCYLIGDETAKVCALVDPGGSLEKILEVLHTPGHSAGSVTLLAEDVMLCGDTLFTGSCGRWDLTGGDYGALQKSLARLGRLEGDYKVCPGHGPASTLERERRTNPCLRQALGL